MNCALAPGKIILSGEHSVIYGAPALVAAVNRFTRVYFTPIHRSRTIRTALKGISTGRSYPLAALHRLRAKLDQRFEQYNRGERAVQNILTRPDDLVIYSLATLCQHLPVLGRSATHGFPVPGRLASDSELPLGAGMGSSAAAIAATLVLYEHLTGRTMSARQRFERVRFCERLQHGKGSAIDAAATVYGGLQQLHDGEPAPLPVTLGAGWYWTLSGIPVVSTGECVAHVRHHFAPARDLWAEFAATTNDLQQQLQTDGDPRAALRHNQHLLQQIGVTPEPAAQFIAAVERAGGAAKISGAGAHRGAGGGIILVYHPDPTAIEPLLQQTGWQWDALSLAPHGAQLVSSQ